MKLHFEPNLEYQQEAIQAVCQLFRGQEACRSEFTVTCSATHKQAAFEYAESDLGIGNRLLLSRDRLLENLQQVQLRHGLRPSTELQEAPDFTIEMETGTGKTYVYLRTLFELHKQYNFTKFVIVVPSVAIKEGVYKSLQMMAEHFRALYANVPFDFFLYDSSKLGDVRSFATSPQIQIMVVTVGAINKKDVNNLYKDKEQVSGLMPIELLRATRPILIVDEPQSVDGGLEGRGKEALAAMHPLCTLRYSATHVDKHHMVYRLDAVDAYDKKLVKQIEVAAAEVEDANNSPYVRLLEVTSKKGRISAKVELDCQTLYGVSRREVVVQDGDDLEQTTSRAVYRNCRVGELQSARGKEKMELRMPGNEFWLRPGESFGGVSIDKLQESLIRRTIKAHLQKELRLKSQGIKVLSLFFIDKVEHYRQYDQDGKAVPGKYVKMFEDEYRRQIKLPEFTTLFNNVETATPPALVHDGYFSIDKKGGWTDTEENNQSSRDNAERAYNLIMKDKERLLSFETPLKFIFSHSALREGWDNPNVFQICTLREIGSERERRQTIGRGLRLCVNQRGERVRGFDVNTLTVVATESYEQFADSLQKEIEQDTGIRFGLVEEHQFASLPVTDDKGQTTALGLNASQQLWHHLKEQGLIDRHGKVQDSLRRALKEGTLTVPEPFQGQLPQIQEVLRKIAGKLEIKNADDAKPIRLRKDVLLGPDFQALWDRIKHKTTYRVQFDNQVLIQKCKEALAESLPITRARLVWRTAELAVTKAGITTELKEKETTNIEEEGIELPDLLTELLDKTQLTRRSLAQIVLESGRLDDFKRNPQQFISQAVEAINRTKRMVLVDGIKYQRMGADQFYAMELFQQEELRGYLKNMLAVNKSVHEHIVYDSAGVERGFADQLEKNPAVKVYAKLPAWFKVATPLGSYNPDWAVLVEAEGEERLYFVVETKGGLFSDDLRGKEEAKIKCGKAHFNALADTSDPARFVVATSVEDLMKFV